MDKIIMVDGNNLLFRSYYATAYNGNFMKNSKGFPTNALFGFANMINKIVSEEKPIYMIVAFDKGKTFRHDKYDDYKAGRIEMPDELRMQFPRAKEMLTHMGIKYYEIDNYEADDIIGTFANYCDLEEKYIGTIISSDKDLLQLISDDVDIKLLKSKDYIRYNKQSFKDEYGIDPINVIDLKALMGDSSDNIPGVRGIGEKTALKLLQDYKTLDGVYENLDKLSLKMREKLEEDKEKAYMSYDLATIYREVPMGIDINDIVYKGSPTSTLNSFYEELEFYSFLKKENAVKEEAMVDVKIINSLEEIKTSKPVGIHAEMYGDNYHNSKIIGMGIYNEDIKGFIPIEIITSEFLKGLDKYVYDVKKSYVAFKWLDIDFGDASFDTMLAAYLLDYNVKDDIAYLANGLDYSVLFKETLYGKENKPLNPSIESIAGAAVLKAKFVYETKEMLEGKLKEEEMIELYNTIELPLAYVLGDMEYNGVYIDESVLNEMGAEIKIKLELISNDIYNYAGCEFNIASPQQLGEVLFEKLQLAHGKKGKTGYSTAVDTLTKLKDKHPIIDLILEYRMLSKLYSTYIEGLKNTILKDGKIHTIYMQALTRTGRLSSIEPNLQNIPIRYEYGKLIRKAFVPSEDSYIVSSDYSQIELRILAHTAGVKSLIDAFNDGRDIHTKTASDIFHVSEDIVTKDMRRMAKAVNFGIIYGISSYGLSENLGIMPKEASAFIDDYLKTYPGIKGYMDSIISKAHHDGYVKTMFGRKRIIPELSNKNYMIRQSGERMALNTPIQGTSADIIKKAMIDVDRLFKENNLESKMILQVHDELIFDVKKDELEKVKELVKKAMEEVYKLDVPLGVEIEYGKNWLEAK